MSAKARDKAWHYRRQMAQSLAEWALDLCPDGQPLGVD
jgi:hypothetical protein